MKLQYARHEGFRGQSLLQNDQVLRACVIKPEAAGNQNEEREAEQKAALSFQTRLADDLLECSIRNHNAVLLRQPRPSGGSESYQVGPIDAHQNFSSAYLVRNTVLDGGWKPEPL